MRVQERYDSISRNVRFTSTVSLLMIALMMACLAYGLIQFVQRFIPGWSPGFLVIFTFLVSLEAIYTRRAMRRAIHGNIESILSWVSEVILILLALKFSAWISSGFGNLQQEIKLMSGNFFKVFFSMDYLIMVIIVFLVWIISKNLAGEMILMEGDELLLNVREDDQLLDIRQQIRKNVSRTILIIGAILVVLNAILRYEEKLRFGSITGSGLNGSHLLLYFLFGMVFLSLTELSVLRVNWINQNAHIQDKLAQRFSIYSMLFILVLILLAVLLPSEYSAGLLSLLNKVLIYCMAVLGFLLALISLPFIMLISFLMSLISREPESVQMPQIPTFTPPPAISVEQPGWLEMVRVFLFWGLILGLAVFSIIYYFREHNELWYRLRGLSPIRWIFSLWSWFSGRLSLIKQGITSLAERGIAGFRPQAPILDRASPRWFVNLRRLPPRDRVIYFYLTMLQKANRSGMTRHVSQTPYEFEKVFSQRFISETEQSEGVRSHLQDDSYPIEDLTDRFVEARYSNHLINDKQAIEAQSSWKKVLQLLRRKKRDL